MKVREIKKSLLFVAAYYMASNKSAFAVAAGATAGVTAYLSGIDPWPWVIATVGMCYMLARSEPDTSKTANRIRRDALANGLVSLVCGGLGGPWTAVAVGEYINPKLANPLLMAFMISAFWQVIAYRGWPFFLAEIWPIVKSWLSKKNG